MSPEKGGRHLRKHGELSEPFVAQLHTKVRSKQGDGSHGQLQKHVADCGCDNGMNWWAKIQAKEMGKRDKRNVSSGGM